MRSIKKIFSRFFQYNFVECTTNPQPELEEGNHKLIDFDSFKNTVCFLGKQNEFIDGF